MISRRQVMAATATLLGLSVTPACTTVRGSGVPIERRLRQIEATYGGRLGVAILDSDGTWLGAHREHERFPLLSTFKLLLAGAILARADDRKLSLEDRIRYSSTDLVTYSPVTERHVGSGGMTIAELCHATMTSSDNTAANLLLRQLGGPAGLTTYLRSIGDEVTRLDRWETDLNEATPGDPRDTSTPAAVLKTVRTLTLGDALSSESRLRLQTWLRQNRTGNARLRALLPPAWSAGEKTGTGSYRTSNDVGLLWPPDGAPILVAAYLTEGAADSSVRDAALAQVGAAIVANWSR